MVNKDKYYSAIIVSMLPVILVLVTGTLFQNQLSEAQEDSLYQFFENGKSSYDLGNYQEAITWFDKVLAIDPDGVDALNMKGKALDSDGQHQEAITWFDKALAIDSNDVNSLVNKGFALDSLSQHQEAITWFDKALAIDPSDDGALYGKDAALDKLGK